MKKVIGLVILLSLVIIGGLWLQDRNWSPPIQHKGVNASTWSSGLESANGNNTKLSFWVTIWNDSTNNSYVTDLKLKLPNQLRKHILSGDTTITVNQSLNPNATYRVKGELILNTKGMTKQEIVNLGNIQGFVVETAQK